MRGKISGLFSISEKESKYFNDKEGFIELESCPLESKICIEHLDFINKKMRKSRSYWLNKDFPQAIEELKMAHHKTTELNQPSCLQCTELFRSTITISLEAIQEDLKDMTSGIFKAKRFNSSLKLATIVLAEFNTSIRSDTSGL